MTAYALSAAKLANNLFEHIVNPLIAFLGFIALMILVIGAMHFMFKADSAQERKEILKKLAIMIFGIFVVFSVWSIFRLAYRLADSPPLSPPSFRDRRARFFRKSSSSPSKG